MTDQTAKPQPSTQLTVILQAYYLILLGCVHAYILPLASKTNLKPVFQWPLNLFDELPLSPIILVGYACVFSFCVCASLQPTRYIWRLCVFVSMLLLNSAFCSAGAVTHLFQFWLWTSCIIAISKPEPVEMIYAAQSILLLFYGLSGLWKTLGAISQISAGEPSLFGSGGLGYHVASEMLRTGARPMLGTWILAHPITGQILGVLAAALQLSCLVGIFQLRFRVWLGWGLLLFHIATFTMLSITYPTNFFLIIVLLILPQLAVSDYNHKLSATHAFLIFYFITSLLTGLFHPKKEVFPIFNGSWFYKVPHTVSDYGLWITHLDGQQLTVPRYLDQMYRAFPTWPTAAYQSVQALGEAFIEKSDSLSRQQKVTLQLIFQERPYTAELRRRRLDLLNYLQTGLSQEQETLTHLKGK